MYAFYFQKCPSYTPDGANVKFSTTLQRQYTENSKRIFPEMKLRGLSPNIHVSVSDVQCTYFHDRSAYCAAGKYSRWTDCGNI
jgi:hypothetical protein